MVTFKTGWQVSSFFYAQPVNATYLCKDKSEKFLANRQD